MVVPFFLSRENTGLLVVDVQEKLFPVLDSAVPTVNKILMAIRGCRFLNVPIVITEQCPRGLGPTVDSVKASLVKDQQPLVKTTFSCLGDDVIKKTILSMSVTQWIVVGIEAHVCVLLTAKDLLDAGKQVVVAADATTSRSAADAIRAHQEMRDSGVRVSGVETILFELLGDATSPQFKEMSQLVR